MSDPILGPLIHIFVDENKIEKDKDLDQVNFVVCRWSLFVVGLCLLLVVVCRWSLFVVGRCLSLGHLSIGTSIHRRHLSIASIRSQFSLKNYP